MNAISLQIMGKTTAWTILLAIALLLPGLARAEVDLDASIVRNVAFNPKNVYAEFGTGVMNSSQTEYSQVKYGELGLRKRFNDTFEYDSGVGLWSDASRYPGAKSSLYLVARLGIEPHLRNLVVGYYLGPAFVTTPDTVLASNLQVSQELIVGVRDARNVRIYISVKHFSNAGILQPNKGRNFVGLGVQF